MREFHPKVWAVRWLMAGVVMALLGCQSAPPPTMADMPPIGGGDEDALPF